MVIDGARGRDRWDFFVSYTRADQAWAEWISAVLEEKDYRVLVQAWDSVPGRNWPLFIDEGVRDASFLLVVLTPDYLRSKGGTAEWQAVWASDLPGERRRVVPVLIEPCEPRELGILRTRSWIDLSDLAVGGDGDEARRRLLAGVTAAREGRAKPPGPAVFPRQTSTVVSAEVRTRPSEPLPDLPDQYIPRDRDLAAVRGLLTRPGDRVVGLVGMGGAGKSTLARAVVDDEAVRRAFPDGIVWVEVNPDPDLASVLSRVLSAFGSPGPVSDVVDGSDRLRALLAGAAALIVLDNVWDVGVLDALRVSAPSRILVTARTREALFTSPTVHDVGRLEDGEARQVLARYAGCPPEELPPAADPVIARCGGLVFALALTGGMARDGSRWTTIAERLRRADLDRLAGKFPGYPHPNLLAALEVSVGTLSADDAARFRELVVFDRHGPVPVGAAFLLWRTTAGVDPLDADDLMVKLGRRSIVQLAPGGETFTLHDLMFDYARHTLPTDAPASLHGQLAHAFLDRWGGLAAALPALRDHGSLDSTDRHGVDHLIDHLLAADESDIVDGVITAEWPTGPDRADNAWYTVHESLGRTDGYLADIRAARRGNHTDPTTPVGFGRHALYALIIGSVTSIAANIPAPLLVRAVQEHIWPPQRALVYAQATPNPRERSQALSGLAPHLPAGQRGEVLDRALAAATSIDDPYSRARALSELAPHLPADLLDRALAAATSIDDPYSRAEALSGLAPHLPAGQRGEVLDRALAAAASIDDPSSRARVLSELAPHLPADLLDRALAAAASIDDPYSRAEALSGLAPHLPAGRQSAIFTQAATAGTLVSRSSVVEVLTRAVAAGCSSDQKVVLALIVSMRWWP